GPLLAIGAVAFALVGVYSLAAPWLATRELESSSAAIDRNDFAAALADAKTAHSYDPLSVDALMQQAALESDPARARRLYRDAITLEPLNPEIGRASCRERVSSRVVDATLIRYKQEHTTTLES